MAKQWEPYKEEILRLYMIEDLTLDQVKDRMSTSRGFDRKKHQYEHRLKQWGMRKNMKREEWEYISHQHRKQNRLHHNSNVYVDGVPLGRSRLARALQRYQPDVSLARKFGRPPSPGLPNSHLIRLASSQSSELSIDWPNSLPWLQFERRFTITLPPSTKLIHLLAQTAQNLGLMPAMENKTSFDFARAIYLASREAHSGAIDLARMLHDSWRSAMPFNSSNSAGIAAQMLKTILFHVSNKTCRARHAISYSLYGYDMTCRGEYLLVLFQELHKTHPMVLNQLLTWTDPTSEAIIESLYEDAVRYGKTALISKILSAGRDINALLNLSITLYQGASRGRLHLSCSDRIHPVTPLQWATSVGDIELATHLIDAGAKANIGEPAPLAILCSNTKADGATILRFASQLIHHGAQVNIATDAWVSPLMGAVASENEDLVRFLLQHGAMDVIKRKGLWPTIQLTHDLLLTKYWRIAFPGEAHDTDPVSALQSSMLFKNSSITDMLIHSILNQRDGKDILEWALVTACVVGDKDLVRRLLAHLQAHFDDKISLVGEIIMATAWEMDCRIASLLIDHSTVQRELRNSSLSFFQAAALHGNISLIKLLKSRGFDVNSGPKLQLRLMHPSPDTWKVRQPPPLASTHIGCAIWMGHKDAVETLLAIGADVAAVHLVSATQSGSQDLASRVLDRCDDVNEPWDGQRALDVAIRCRTGIGFIRKLIDAGAVIHGYELVDAVRSNDREVVQFLLSSCNVLATDENGESVLEAACRTGNIEIATLFYACGGAYSSRAILLAANRAVKTRDYHVVEYLVTTRKSGPIDKYEASALALSIRMEDPVLVNIFISDHFGSSPALSIYCRCCKADGQSGDEDGVGDWVYPLDYDNQHIDIRYLCITACSYGSNCCQRFSPMSVAALMGQGTLVRTMINRGDLPDAFLIEIIHGPSYNIKEIREAITTAYTSQIPGVEDRDWNERLLTVALKHNTDIKIIQEHLKHLTSLDFWHGHYSPLERVVRSDRLELTELLLKAGASPNARRSQHSNRGAFILAMQRGNLDIASLLLDYGANINVSSSEALTSAVWDGDLRAITFLLEKGADVNIPQITGRRTTPLELAARRGMLDTVELIITSGFDFHGRMRIHFIRAVVEATRMCHYGTAKLLKERGGWTDKDKAIAKTTRGPGLVGDCCARFLYDDPSLETCGRCLMKSETSSSCSYSDDDESTTSDPEDLMAFTEQFEDHEVGPVTDELSILDLNSEMMEDGQTIEWSDWSLVPYGPQDRELDDIVRGLLLEDGMIIDLE